MNALNTLVFVTRIYRTPRNRLEKENYFNIWPVLVADNNIKSLGNFPHKTRFPLGDFFRANKQKVNAIGW
jgi:hypothetical protein